ncbi:MAG TPA: ABC transporter permease, partial [Gemmatimonadaceae bacterium]|nr:ABC transporter permease [Gemmatimonadaceae bacterium]
MSSSSSRGRALANLQRDPRAWFGGGVILLLLLAALGAPVVARHDPLQIDLIHQLQPPSAAHWLGTDIQGRDVWARLVFGARISLSVGIVSQAI